MNNQFSIQDNLKKIIKNNDNVFLGIYFKVLTSIIKIIKNKSPKNSEISRSTHL